MFYLILLSFPSVSQSVWGNDLTYQVIIITIINVVNPLNISDMYNTLGKTLKRLRQECGLSQKVIAKRLKIDQTYLCKIEKDSIGAKMSDQLISAIAAEYGITEHLIRRLLKKPSANDLSDMIALYAIEKDFPDFVRAMITDDSFRNQVMYYYYREHNLLKDE